MGAQREGDSGPVRCGLCGELLLGKVRMESHLREVHERRDRESPCLICDIVFPSQAELMLHVSQVHMATEGACANCGVRKAVLGCLVCRRNLCETCFDEHEQRLSDDEYEGYVPTQDESAPSVAGPPHLS